jgi:2,3-dihydroxyphenylpropionate 1,2-dioxygenase (EC 1.13.11.16)
MSAYLHCLSHTPLVGYVDPAQAVLAEVDEVVAAARARIAAFDPSWCSCSPRTTTTAFFYDVMPAFCIGMGATAIGDFNSAAGPLDVPRVTSPRPAPMRCCRRVWTLPCRTACRSIMVLPSRWSCCSMAWAKSR